ncbi:hypothetical protein QAD02_005413 [Eretmocerus hayati]|uniref:Uncharacterized protein n=1 Tax=Eretmocerus hayati TaxID=131215 RepID=A0ACC2NSN9_9HYME|nr:hypothetical protein QAD02_005413 [Eretmocerus hayati]
MDEDPRGIKRGPCMAPDCDCTAYERSKDKASCYYCSCPPTKHRRKDVIVLNPADDHDLLGAEYSKTHSFGSETIILSDPASLNSSASNSFEQDGILTPESTMIEQNDISSVRILHCIVNQQETRTSKVLSPPKAKKPDSQSSVTLNDENSSPLLNHPKSKKKLTMGLKNSIEQLANRKEKIIASFPNIWPDRIEDWLAKKTQSDDKILNLFIRTLVDKLKENKIAEAADFDVAAEVAYERYEVLRTNVSTSHGYLSALMKRCLHNKRYYEKKLEKTKKKNVNVQVPLNENPTTLEDTLNKMNTEMQQANPSITILKECLELCRTARVAHSKISSADNHLRKFTALKKSDLLLWEFHQVFQIQSELMRTRWIEASLKLEEHFSQVHTDDEDVRTVNLLRLISKKFNKKNKEAFEAVVKVYDENTPTIDTVPSGDAAPRMIGIGTTERPALNFIIYVDKVPLFTGTAVNSLIFLFASYWIFNISFPSKANMTFTFIAAILFQDHYYDDFKDKRTVVKLIEEIGIFNLPKK